MGEVCVLLAQIKGPEKSYEDACSRPVAKEIPGGSAQFTLQLIYCIKESCFLFQFSYCSAGKTSRNFLLILYRHLLCYSAGKFIPSGAGS